MLGHTALHSFVSIATGATRHPRSRVALWSKYVGALDVTTGAAQRYGHVEADLCTNFLGPLRYNQRTKWTFRSSSLLELGSCTGNSIPAARCTACSIPGSRTFGREKALANIAGISRITRDLVLLFAPYDDIRLHQMIRTKRQAHQSYRLTTPSSMTLTFTPPSMESYSAMHATPPFGG
jgi:hypothetical protein